MGLAKVVCVFKHTRVRDRKRSREKRRGGGYFEVGKDETGSMGINDNRCPLEE